MKYVCRVLRRRDLIVSAWLACRGGHVRPRCVCEHICFECVEFPGVCPPVHWGVRQIQRPGTEPDRGRNITTARPPHPRLTAQHPPAPDITTCLASFLRIRVCGVARNVSGPQESWTHM